MNSKVLGVLASLHDDLARVIGDYCAIRPWHAECVLRLFNGTFHETAARRRKEGGGACPWLRPAAPNPPPHCAQWPTAEPRGRAAVGGALRPLRLRLRRRPPRTTHSSTSLVPSSTTRIGAASPYGRVHAPHAHFSPHPEPEQHVRRCLPFCALPLRPRHDWRCGRAAAARAAERRVSPWPLGWCWRSRVIRAATTVRGAGHGAGEAQAKRQRQGPSSPHSTRPCLSRQIRGGGGGGGGGGGVGGAGLNKIAPRRRTTTTTTATTKTMVVSGFALRTFACSMWLRWERVSRRRGEMRRWRWERTGSRILGQKKTSGKTIPTRRMERTQERGRRTGVGK